MTITAPPTGAERDATVAWSQRVRRVGGFIQLAFAAFWLVRGALSIGGLAGTALAGVALITVVFVLVYAIWVTSGTGRRPTSPEAKRIERSVTVATLIELAASFALPVIVIAAGHSDWVLPSIAITIGPLLLWLDHLVHIPRYRPIGWALTTGPLILTATMSGTALAATTGLAAGVLLLATAIAGFHDLAAFQQEQPTVLPSTPQPGELTGSAYSVFLWDTSQALLDRRGDRDCPSRLDPDLADRAAFSSPRAYPRSSSTTLDEEDR